MPSASFTAYPYPALNPGDLKLALTASSLPADVPEAAEGSFNARDRAEPFEIELTPSFRSERRAAQKFGHSTIDQVLSRTSLHILGAADRSRTRFAVSKTPLEPKQSVPYVLDPAQLRGRLDLYAVLTYREDGSENLSFHRCGESEPISFHFDDASAPPGSDLEIRWLDFTDPSNGLQDRSEQYFILRGHLDPPSMLLNSGIQGLHSTLMGTGTRGPRVHVRRSVFHRIASQAWVALLSEMLSEFHDHMSDPTIELDPNDVAEGLGSWKKAALGEFAEKGLSTGIRGLAEQLSTTRQTVLLTDVPNYVQALLKGVESFPGLLKATTSDTPGDLMENEDG